MSVVSFAAAKEARQPHWEGQCVCLGCRHEWQGVGPIGTHVGLECPSCDLPKGTVKYPFGAQVGDLEFRCLCGCEAMAVYKRRSDGLFITRCMGCGEDQKAAIYGEPA